MKIISRTIMGSRLQTMLLLGLPYSAVANTTLNEKFDVQSGVLPDNPTTTIPRVRYFCIGNGGHRNATGADGTAYTTPIQHSAGDGALYNHLPFLIRPVDEDISVVERAKYAMRVVQDINGESYVAYYLKRLDFTDVSPTMMHNTVVDGVTTSVPFVPTGANLNPTAPAIPATGVTTTNGDYLSASALLNLAFTAEDVAELVNVAQVMYDNEYYAVISEIGLVAGVDKIVTADAFGGGTFNYLEAIQAQITTHITGHYPIGYTNQGFDFGLELGATEPLIGVTTGP